MVEVKPFRLGVVEGFFGKSWSWEDRAHYAQFLGGNGFTTYLYAPKNDDCFRKQWHQPCPVGHLDNLKKLAAKYRAAGVEFAIGLSPFEIYLDFSEDQQAALARKLEEINDINPDALCILFDDMQGAVTDLAKMQLKIMDWVTRNSKARHYIFCPTYYSDDPVLATHFGAMPGGYLEDIGSQLDSRIDIFWTGPKVFSDSFPEEHLQDVAERLHRKPLLWDNYPVNDSRALTDYLHLAPFKNRSPALKSLAQGHMANPMNQARLSQLPLFSLGRLYNDAEPDMDNMLADACKVLCPKGLGELILGDYQRFQETGLKNLTDNDKSRIRERYAAFADVPMVQELFDWLQGDYEFDPQCLT